MGKCRNCGDQLSTFGFYCDKCKQLMAMERELPALIQKYNLAQRELYERRFRNTEPVKGLEK